MFARNTGYHWCEPKYAVSPYIAEFANTMTNIPIVLLPLVNVVLAYPYLRQHPEVLLPLITTCWVGVASMLYHGTLSLFTQLLDELAILWVLCMIAYTLLPCLHCVPQKIKDNIDFARECILVGSVVTSLMCFLSPMVNALALLSLSVPFVMIMMAEAKRLNYDALHQTIHLMLGLWAFAVFCWVLDRSGCDMLRYIGIPYMHAVFHVSSAFAMYVASVALLYMHMQHYAPQYSRVAIRYTCALLPHIDYVQID